MNEVDGSAGRISIGYVRNLLFGLLVEGCGLSVDIEKLRGLAELEDSDVEGAEENVKYKIIIPFLEALGHAKDLHLEFRTGRDEIDIKIKNLSDEMNLIVECKALNKDLDEYIEQLERYSFEHRPYPRIAVISNGNEFRCYGPRLDANSFAEKLFFSFTREDLKKDNIVELIASVLSRAALVSGAAREAVERIFKQKKEEEARRRAELEKLKAELVELRQRKSELEEKLRELSERENEIETALGGEGRKEKATDEEEVICDEETLAKYKSIMKSLEEPLEKRFGKWASSFKYKRKDKKKFTRYAPNDRSEVKVGTWWKLGNGFGIGYVVYPKTKKHDDEFCSWILLISKNAEIVSKFRDPEIVSMLQKLGYREEKIDWGVLFEKPIAINDKFSLEEHQRIAIEEIERIKPVVEALLK